MTKLIKHGLKAGSVAARTVETIRAAGHSMSGVEIAVSLDTPAQQVSSALTRLSKSGFVTCFEGTWPRQYDLGPRVKP
mgnify:CR=1 FL=1